MPSNNESSRLELFKTFSTFFSSVIIASASIVITLTYNSQQLEITNKQVVSQMNITRIKEISKLVPKLGSDNTNERKFSAITLSLYGKDALPALIALLEDENSDVREVSTKAIALIGEPAIPELEAAFKNRRNSDNLRSSSIYTLGRMKSPKAIQLSIKAIEDTSEKRYVRKDAASALGMLKSEEGIPILLKAMQSKTNDLLVENSVWALGEIGNKVVYEDLYKILDHNNDKVRLQVVWALAKLKNQKTENILRDVIEKDISQEVRDAAVNAIEWMK